jgi:GNAT superfamily N-acetyltransferase
MGLDAGAFAPAPPVSGLTVREAGPEDLETVAAIDAEAFGGEPDDARPWIAPRLGAPGFTVALAELGGEPAATAHAIVTDSAAGPAVLLGGVAVAAAVRRRGIGAAISSWLLAGGFAAGARLAHLHADTDGAARVYGRLGFGEAGALAVFEDA